MALVLCISSVANAATLFWYNELGAQGNCLESGVPQASVYTCDHVGASYLPNGHVVDGSLNRNLEQGVQLASGDYCKHYNLGEPLNRTDGSKESVDTGYEPPAPLTSYQVSNHNKSGCQANEGFWGQEVRGAVSNQCHEPYAPCGMQHYISLTGQNLTDRPWSGAFVEPKLVISAQVIAHTETSVQGAWGYFCPWFEDVSSGNILEYCLSEWKHGTGVPKIVHYDEVPVCNSAAGHNIDQAITDFAKETRFATNRATETFSFNANSGWRTFTAEITPSELETAIAADNATCNRASSLNPENWALVGVEQGEEGVGVGVLGGASGNPQLWTEYTNFTENELSPQSNSWMARDPKTFAQYVYWRGSDGNVWTTVWTGSAWKPPEQIARPEGGGYAMREGTTPGVVMDPTTRNQFVYFQGTDGGLWTLSYSGGWHSTPLFGQLAPGASPAVVRDLNTGSQYVYWRGSDGNVWTTVWTGSKWKEPELIKRPEGGGYAIREGTNPGVVIDPSRNQFVYFQGTDGGLWTLSYAGGWQIRGLGGQLAPGASPAVVRDPSTGSQYVYWRGSDGNMWTTVWTGSTWKPAERIERPEGGGYGVREGTNPGVVMNPSTREQFVYFQGTDGALWTLSYAGGWHLTPLFGQLAPGSSPTAVRDERTGDQFTYWKGLNGNVAELFTRSWNGREWEPAQDLGGSLG